MNPPEVVVDGGFRIVKHGLREGGEAVYGVRYSNDGAWLAATLGSGALRVFKADPATGNFSLSQRSKLGQGYDDMPSCSVRFRPTGEFTEEGIQELVTCSSAGGVFGFNIDTTDAEEMFLDRTWRAAEEGNDTICCDFSPNGLLLASVGADRTVRIYDANTRKLKDTLSKGHDDGGHTRPAHTNRIYCAKFVNDTTLVTGGWEAPVQIWDMRTGRSERQIGGPHVSSDTIDLVPGTQHVVIGSARQEKQLQVFDFLGCREIVSEGERLCKSLERAAVANVKVSRDAKSLWVATNKPDQVFCFDLETGAVKGKVAAPQLVFGLDTCPTNPNRAVCVGNKELFWTLDTLA